jgi:hypothetical protein
MKKLVVLPLRKLIQFSHSPLFSNSVPVPLFRHTTPTKFTSTNGLTMHSIINLRSLDIEASRSRCCLRSSTLSKNMQNPNTKWVFFNSSLFKLFVLTIFFFQVSRELCFCVGGGVVVFVFVLVVVFVFML